MGLISQGLTGSSHGFTGVVRGLIGVGYDLVSFALKELEERVTNLISAHVHAALPENSRVRILPYCRSCNQLRLVFLRKRGGRRKNLKQNKNQREPFTANLRPQS